MPDNGWTTATLGLGGNIGRPIEAMASALRRLDARPDCRIAAVSRLYRTPPWGKTDQAFFYNACASVETTLAPEPLLEACLDIEREMKRVRNERWGPRTIDIDILTFGNLHLKAETLELPHPRMTDRGFVLTPLNDISPDMTVNGRPIRDWLAAADVEGIEIADEDGEWWRSSEL